MGSKKKKPAKQFREVLTFFPKKLFLEIGWGKIKRKKENNVKKNAKNIRVESYSMSKVVNGMMTFSFRIKLK